MKKIRIAAFDLSLNATGYAAVSDTQDAQMETIAPAKGVVGMERLHYIRREVRGRVNNATLVVMEELAFAAQDRNHERAGLAMLVRHRLWLDKIPYILVAPTALKKFILGSGKGEKSMILKAVYKRWKIDASNDNEADAVGLCYIGKALTGRYRMNKSEAEVVAKIRVNPFNASVLKEAGI